MFCVGMAKVQLGADAEAVDWLRRSIEANRNFPVAHFEFAGALALTVSILMDRPGRSSIGLLLILAGLPFYRYWSRAA